MNMPSASAASVANLKVTMLFLVVLGVPRASPAKGNACNPEKDVCHHGVTALQFHMKTRYSSSKTSSSTSPLSNVNVCLAYNRLDPHWARPRKRSAHLVISVCNEQNLSWIQKKTEEIEGNYGQQKRYEKMFVYSKCGKAHQDIVGPNVDLLKSSVKTLTEKDVEIKKGSTQSTSASGRVIIKDLPNVGSCDYAYLTYILDRMAEDAEKGLMEINGEYTSAHYPANTSFPEEVLFTKGQLPVRYNVDYGPPRICSNQGSPSGRVTQEWESFDLPGYNFTNNVALPYHRANERYRRLDNYLDALGILDDDLRVHAPTKADLLFRRGRYLMTRMQIMSTPRAIYQHIRNQQRYANEEIDHFVERLWAPLACYHHGGDTGYCENENPTDLISAGTVWAKIIKKNEVRVGRLKSEWSEWKRGKASPFTDGSEVASGPGVLAWEGTLPKSAHGPALPRKLSIRNLTG